MTLYIDIGSTNIKWENSAGDKGSEVFPATSSAFPFFEIDPGLILNKILKIINSQRNLRKVFFSVQMHGFILAQNGTPVTPYISWRDKRAALCRPRIELNARSGTCVKDNLPLVSILSMKERGQLPRFNGFFTLGSYIVHALTGKNVTHITDAASSGFFDLDGRQHHYGLSCDLPQAAITVESAGFFHDIEIFTPVGDHQAAVLSASTDNSYILNTGTAAQMCVVSADYIKGEFESRPYFEGKTLCTVTGLIGGELFYKGAGIEELADNYEAAIKNLPERKSVIAVGGFAVHNQNLITKIFTAAGLPFSVQEKAGALEGLKILEEQII